MAKWRRIIIDAYYYPNDFSTYSDHAIITLSETGYFGNVNDIDFNLGVVNLKIRRQIYYNK